MIVDTKGPTNLRIEYTYRGQEIKKEGRKNSKVYSRNRELTFQKLLNLERTITSNAITGS